MPQAPRSAVLDEILALLDLEEIDKDLFRGSSPELERDRVFGGQVAAQALVAAGRSVDDLVVHSMHSHFLRAGDYARPILYEVDRIRDGRSFATRRVTAIQSGAAILHMTASYHRVEPGLEHQIDPPETPDPETLPSYREWIQPLVDLVPPDLKERAGRERETDVRYADPVHCLHPEKAQPAQRVWIRASGSLPDDPKLHQVLLAYTSDSMMLETALRPHGISRYTNRSMVVTLDHTIWFHRPCRMDDWQLVVLESPAAVAARALVMGRVYTRDGRIVASVAQEGLVRKLDAPRQALRRRASD